MSLESSQLPLTPPASDSAWALESRVAAPTCYRVNVVGGCGHVGLPLAIMLAARGHEVCIYDLDVEAIARVERGEMPFKEADAEPLLAEALASGRLTLSREPATLTAADLVIVVIGTPVDEHLSPEFGAFQQSLETFLPHLRDDQVLVLRSTLYPGTSQKIERFLAERGKRVHVAYCPERIAEGHALTELTTLPQIVSGFSPEAVERSSALFSTLTDAIVVLDPLEAELAKLFTNTYRYLNFAVANQFYQIATEAGLDFYRIHHAMTHRYPRAAHFPTPGFTAGPCLFKDTMQLSAFAENQFMLGHAAMLANEGLPNFVVRKLKEAHPLASRRVGILGMAFKANSDDKRESLSYKLKKLLAFEAEAVLASDVYIREPGFVSPEELILGSDIIIIGTPHAEYRNLDFRGRPVVDVWNCLKQGGLF